MTRSAIASFMPSRSSSRGSSANRARASSPNSRPSTEAGHRSTTASLGQPPQPLADDCAHAGRDAKVGVRLADACLGGQEAHHLGDERGFPAVSEWIAWTSSAAGSTPVESPAYSPTSDALSPPSAI